MPSENDLEVAAAIARAAGASDESIARGRDVAGAKSNEEIALAIGRAAGAKETPTAAQLHDALTIAKAVQKVPTKSLWALGLSGISGTPVLGTGIAAGAAALTGDVAGARAISNMSVGFALAGAHALAPPLIPVIAGAGAAQTAAVVAVAESVRNIVRGVKF